MATNSVDEILKEETGLKWDDVCGLEEAKQATKEAIQALGGGQPCKGVLWFGAPGCGKTYMSQALATEAGIPTFSITSCDLMSRWRQEESHKWIQGLFELARERRPSVIFIDDVDLLCDEKSDHLLTIKAELIKQMTDVEDNNDILVLASTCKPMKLHADLRQRFKQRIYIPPPEEAARTDIFRKVVSSTSHTLADEDFQELGRKTEHYTPADIFTVVRDAAMQYVRTVQKAKHYRRVSGPDPAHQELIVDDLWMPCSGEESGAVKKDWSQIETDKLYEPGISMADLQVCLAKKNTWLNDQELKQFQEFTDAYGQED